MILAITPNPAVDVTYTTPHLELGAVHRVEVARRAGGKGINVARVLSQRGVDARALGIIGGDSGAFISDDLRRNAISASWVMNDTDTRTTVNVVTESGDSTMLNEPGQPLGVGVWAKFVEETNRLAKEASVAVVSGSFPQGVSDVDQMALFAAAGSASHTIFDVSGPALLTAARAGATLLKPNSHELLSATGADSVQDGVNHLLDLGAQAVALSLGEDGLHLITRDLHVAARLPQPVHGNPTGAGDTVVAALAQALEAYGPSVLTNPALATQALHDAVAASAATVISPLAGEYHENDYTLLLPTVETEQIHAAR